MLRAQAIPTRSRPASASIRAQIEETTSDYDKEKLQERLAKLAGGVAVINVGAATEVEMKERKLRIEDALDGHPRGCGRRHRTRRRTAAPASLPAPLQKLLARTRAGDEQAPACSIVLRALEEPVRQIAINAGVEGSVVVENH